MNLTSDSFCLTESLYSSRFRLGLDSIYLSEEMLMVRSKESGVEGSLFLSLPMNVSKTRTSMGW